jgi:hypothetical protein
MLLKWLHVAGKASASNASIPQSVDSMEPTTVVAAADPGAIANLVRTLPRYPDGVKRELLKKSRAGQIGITE